MTKAASEEPQDERPPGTLWTRLLAGRVTEVCVLSHRGLYLDLPQTLGLEVIQYEAYIYGRYGAVRTPEERRGIAEQLAAEPRWLAIDGPRYWVEPFARRAEAILVMPGNFFVEEAAVRLAARAAWARWRAGRADRARSRRGETEAAQDTILDSVPPPVREVYDDGPMTNDQRAEYYVQMKDYFTGAFPEKTCLPSTEDVKRLRGVRALRRD